MTRRKKIALSLMLVSVFAGILYFGVQSLNVYRQMMKINTGALWRLPARIYSAPFDIRPGQDISKIGLNSRLAHLGYRSSSKLRSPGQYMKVGDGIIIYLHPFQYAQGAKGAQKIRVLLDGDIIKAVVSEKTHKNIGYARIEPECIATIYDSGFEDREVIKLKACPKILIDALLCVEDRRFYNHPGFDLKSISRALLIDIFHAQMVEGGSTITQQLAKNLFLTQERKISRKIREIWLATIMEMVFTKKEILSMYINEIYLGRFGYAGIYGFARASKLFFDKEVSSLDLHEAALLVGIIRAPNIYSPYLHPKAAIQRRNIVLSVMHEQKKISDKQYENAIKRSLGIVPITASNKQAPFFVDHIISTLRAQFPEEDILSKGGISIFTTLDMNMQRTADDVISNQSKGLDRNIQLASVIIDPATGAIRSMVGGRDYASSQFNRATSIRRNIGSLIKPIVYYSALKNGYSLVSILDDSELNIKLEKSRTWSPSNFDNQSHGNVMLIDALAHSYNQATVRIGLAVGLDKVVNEIRDVLPKASVSRKPSVLLGAVECSPVDVAGMYGVYAAQGFKAKTWSLESVVDENGAEIFKAEQQNPLRVLDPGPLYLLNTALKETIRKGTASSAKNYGVPDGICAKTGTTNDLRDSWFAVFSKDLVVVVWLGNDAYRPIGLTGATGALPFAAKMIARLATPCEMAVPDDISFCEVDPVNGKLSTRWTESSVKMPFLKGSEPKEESESGVPGIWKTLKDIFN